VNRAWTEHECAVVIAAANGGLLSVIALGRYGAMRETDAVRFGWTGYDGQSIRWIQSKTGELVEMPAHAELRKILDAMPRQAIVVAVSGRRRKDQPFQPFTVSGFRASFFKLLRKLEKDGKIGHGLTFHGLRHTAGKLLDEAGADPKTIAAMLGQRSIAMAEHYSREGDRRRRTADAVMKLERN